MKKILLVSALVYLLLSACKKDASLEVKQVETTATERITKEEVKDWYDTVKSSNSYKKESAGSTNEHFSISQLKFDLDSLSSVKSQGGNILMTNTNGRVKKESLSYGYRRISFYKNEAGEIKFRIYEIVPDIKYYLSKRGKIENDFTGNILIFDENYKLIGGNRLVNNKVVAGIRPMGQPESGAAKKVTMSSITACSSGSDVSVSYGENGMYEVHYYYYSTCSTVAIQDEMPSTFPSDMGGGGGGGAIGTPPAADIPPVVIPPTPSPKIDPKKFMDCFGTISDDGAKFEVKVLVQQAEPGSTYGYGQNSVGHTALQLTKTGADGQSITQVVGFYPSDHSSFQSPGEVHDNGDLMDYNISGTYQLDAQSFRNVKNYISEPTPMYNLFDFNCTSFAYNAMLTGGVTLPSATGYLKLPLVPNTAGALMTYAFDGPSIMVPADMPGVLGEGMRQQNSPNVSTADGAAPASHGPCN